MARRSAFTLIEALSVVAVVALLVSLLLPAMAGARHVARAAVCLGNLRSVVTLTRAYADDHRGLSPAIGVPYAAPPNWALVIQQLSGRAGSGGDLYHTGNSVLVCPSARAALGPHMTRTYAINATGHAGLDGDPDHYDTGLAFIALDKITRPAETPLFLDSAGSAGPGRTASMIDFRQPLHLAERLARPHPAGPAFNAALADGAARTHRDPPASWRCPLP